MTPEELEELKTIEFTKSDGTIVVPVPSKTLQCTGCELIEGYSIDCVKAATVISCIGYKNKYNQTMIWIKKENKENQS